MRQKRIGLLAILLIVLIYVPIARAADVTSIEIIEYGKYTVQRVGEATKTETGTLESKTSGVTFVQQTQNILATHTNALGVRFKVHGSPSGEAVTVKVVLKTPGITPPGRKKVFDHSTNYQANIEEPFLYWWGFREKWEMVPGTYIIQLFYNDKMYAEKTFKVTTAK
jgi:hypothetical protein